MSKYSNIIKNGFQKWRNTARDTKRLLRFPKKNQKMTKRVISQKQPYVIKKPKSARKILQNKFKPIKNIKLQDIFTKNPKKSRLGTSPAWYITSGKGNEATKPEPGSCIFLLLDGFTHKQAEPNTLRFFNNKHFFIHNTFLTGVY